MTVGPGKYDDQCTLVMGNTHAKGVIVIVVGGDRGEGFACQATLGVALALPEMLRDIANQMEADAPNMRPEPSEA